MGRSNLNGPGPGRPKGSTNKLTADIKSMILGALAKKGGQKWLEAQMDANPNAFMTLLGKVIPTQVQGDPDSPLQLQIIKRVIVDKNA